MYLAAAGADVLYFAVVFAWIHLLRRRLRFHLTGYDLINGHGPGTRGRVPFVAFRARVVTHRAEPDTKKTARHALYVTHWSII